MRSDDKRAVHDHPSDFWTFVVAGRYWDQTPVSAEDQHAFDVLMSLRGMPLYEFTRREPMTPGTLRFRRAEHKHTVVIETGKQCWTMLWVKPPRRLWGFWGTTKNGARRWFRANKWFFEHGHHPCDQ